MMKKYNTTYSRLMSLILNLSEEERALIERQAQQLTGKRKKQRTPCLIPANYDISVRSYSSYILDINDYGAYVETDRRFPVGHILKLKYFDPFCRLHQETQGEIVWSSPNGIGVKFLDFIQADW